MKTLSIQLFVACLILIQSTSGQCPPKCFCLDGSVTCIGLKSIPTFPEDTRLLTIREIDVEQIPAGIFNKLPKLESIEIYDGNVGKISSDAFQSLSLLEFITLSELSIGTVESYAFYNITETGSLTLDLSTIDLIQPYAFFDMFALDHIKITSNKVKYIDSFAFSTIGELLEFSFQNNHVQAMKPYAFSQFSELYKFSMYLNTLGDVGCGSFEPLLYQTEKQSFYSNKFDCTCNIVWAANRPNLKKYLFTNTCQLPGTEEKISWENVSIETLHCSDSDKYECPSAEYYEMLIPNVRITSSTTVASTRTSSRTTLPLTPSNTDDFQEDSSRESKITPKKTATDKPVETSSHKITSTTFKPFSTFEKISKLTPKMTIKASTTKSTARTSNENLEDTKTTKKLPKTSKTIPITPASERNSKETKTTTKLTTPGTSTTKQLQTRAISAIDVNIDSTNLVTLPSNPKIVLSEKTVEVNLETNANVKEVSHEPVSAVLKDDERNGAKAKVNSLCWVLVMTIFIFTVI